MALDLDRLHVLRTKLMQEEDLAEVVKYFFDHFGDDPAFMDLGKPSRNELLDGIIRDVGPRMLGLPGHAKLDRFTAAHLREHGFYHGACTLGGSLVTFFYFDDIQTGAMAAMTSLTGPIQYARFSAQIVRDTSRPPGD
jgi:hypothetical protein